MIAITPFLFLICLPFATDNCDWDLQFTPEGEQVNENHYVRSYPYGVEFGIDYNYKTITVEETFQSFDFPEDVYVSDWIYFIMEEHIEHCTYCGKMSFYGDSFGWFSDARKPWNNMTENERRYVLGMPEKPQRPSIDYPIWYQEKYAKDRNIFYD